MGNILIEARRSSTEQPMIFKFDNMKQFKEKILGVNPDKVIDFNQYLLNGFATIDGPVYQIKNVFYQFFVIEGPLKLE